VSAHLEQWLNLALRWAHVITGIAWIGTSFYFNWLNSRSPRLPPERQEPASPASFGRCTAAVLPAW